MPAFTRSHFTSSFKSAPSPDECSPMEINYIVMGMTKWRKCIIATTATGGDSTAIRGTCPLHCTASFKSRFSQPRLVYHWGWFISPSFQSPVLYLSRHQIILKESCTPNIFHVSNNKYLLLRLALHKSPVVRIYGRKTWIVSLHIYARIYSLTFPTVLSRVSSISTSRFIYHKS